VATILSVPYCPYHFVHAILSNTILSVYHFVRTILSTTIYPVTLRTYYDLRIKSWSYDEIMILGLNHGHRTKSRSYDEIMILGRNHMWSYNKIMVLGWNHMWSKNKIMVLWWNRDLRIKSQERIHGLKMKSWSLDGIIIQILQWNHNLGMISWY